MYYIPENLIFALDVLCECETEKQNDAGLVMVLVWSWLYQRFTVIRASNSYKWGICFVQIYSQYPPLELVLHGQQGRNQSVGHGSKVRLSSIKQRQHYSVFSMQPSAFNHQDHLVLLLDILQQFSIVLSCHRSNNGYGFRAYIWLTFWHMAGWCCQLYTWPPFHPQL